MYDERKDSDDEETKEEVMPSQSAKTLHDVEESKEETIDTTQKNNNVEVDEALFNEEINEDEDVDFD